MPMCATPERRKEERLCATGTVIVYLAAPPTSIVGEVIDVSGCGVGIKYSPAGLLQPEQVFRISYNREEKSVRAVWVLDTEDGGSLMGVLHQEVYLIDRLRSGDKEPFSQLIAPYMRSLRWTVRAILYNRADVEEVVQESLLKAMLHIDQFRRGQSFRSWLLKIANNEALKCIRQNRKHGADAWYAHSMDHAEQEFVEQLIEQMVDPHDTPADALERKEFTSAVHKALDSLDEIYRQIFKLRDLQHLAMPTVANLLGISIDTANTRLHRARLQMRKQLQGNFPTYGRVQVHKRNTA